MRTPPLDPGGGVLFLICRGKINLAASEKVRIFASDFNSEIVEALYLRLADENLRNFHLVQESMTASRV